MGLSGDVSRLNAMTKNLNRLPIGIRTRVALAAVDTIDELLEEQFDQGLAPDGSPWKPLAPSTLKRGRRPPPLTDTGHMRAETHAMRSGTNVAIESTFPAFAHQKGHGSRPTLPRRPIWPDPGRAMPERYETALALSANQALLEAMQTSGLQAAE